MSHLHRFYAKNAPSIWELEGRWMRAAGSFRKPSAVQWIATSACDLTCNHCYSHAGPANPARLSTEEALGMVDQIADAGCDQLVIAGGEPLLRKDLEAVVARVAERGMTWSMHTHGGWVKCREALFRDHPPTMVAVSLDGPRAQHDAFRGRNGAFDAALEAMALLVDWGIPEVIAGTTVTRLNADLLCQMAPIVQQSAAHGWGLHLFAPEGRGEAHTKLSPSPGQLRRGAAFCQRMRREMNVVLDNEWGSAGALDVLYRDEPFLCGAGRFTAVIAVDGSVMPCTTTDPEASEGNIRHRPFGEIWMEGFGAFRGEGTDAAAADGLDCWLQSRHGNSCREHAFGVRPRATTTLPHRPRKMGKPLRWAATMALSVMAAQTAQAQSACEVEAPPTLDVKTWAKHTRMESKERRRADEGVAKLGDTPNLERLTTLLDAMERDQVYDSRLLQQLWVKTPEEGDLTQWLSRLARYSRVVHAILLTERELGAVVHIPWMSKAGPPREYVVKPTKTNVVPGFLEAFQKNYAKGDPSSWATEVSVDVEVKGKAVLCRGGQSQAVKSGSRLRLHRFDSVALPKGSKLLFRGEVLAKRGVWSTRTLPTPKGVPALVEAAASDSYGALDALMPVLALAHREIRIQLAASPEGEVKWTLERALYFWEH